jgi:hypothetical protein
MTDPATAPRFLGGCSFVLMLVRPQVRQMQDAHGSDLHLGMLLSLPVSRQAPYCSQPAFSHIMLPLPLPSSSWSLTAYIASL